MTMEQLKRIITSHKYYVPFILLIAHCSMHLQPHIHVVDKSRVKQEGAVPVSGKQTLSQKTLVDFLYLCDLAAMCLSCCCLKPLVRKEDRMSIKGGEEK